MFSQSLMMTDGVLKFGQIRVTTTIFLRITLQHAIQQTLYGYIAPTIDARTELQYIALGSILVFVLSTFPASISGLLVTVLVVDQHGDGRTTSGTGPACRWRTALRQQATESNGGNWLTAWSPTISTEDGMRRRRQFLIVFLFHIFFCWVYW